MMLAAIWLGCDPQAVEKIEEEALQSVENAAYLRTFELVTEEPFASDAIPDAQIRIWVNDVGYDSYVAMSQGDVSAIPIGSIIVREVINTADEVDKLTLIAKADEGFNSEVGGLWFGQTDPDGVLHPREGGGWMAGALTECAVCHLGQVKQNYLFGAPDGP